MADFYTILRTAVGDSVGYGREARELLYRRAREALSAQLDALETPLSEEQKAAQMAQLDEAAERVEAEFAAAEAEPATEPAEEPSGRPEEVETEEPPADDVSGDEPLPAEAAAMEAGDEALDEAPGETAAAQTQPAGEPDHAGGADDEAVPRRPHTSRRIAPPRRERKRGGWRWGLAIVLLLVFGGAGFAAWRWQDIEPAIAPAVEQAAASVQALLGQEESAPSPEAGKTEAAPQDAPDEYGASGGSQPAGEQETAAAPMAASEETEPAAETAQGPGGELKGAVSPEQESAPEPGAESAPEKADESAPGGAKSEGREVLAEKVIEPAPALRKDQDRVAPSLPLAERAFMIVEQGATGGDDLRYAGSAQWRLEGSGADAVVTVTVQIPERSALMGFVMRRNNDASLPASHLIDISYQGGDSKDGPIINVPGFMVRVAESETPVPVRSAGALIMPGQYLLGLSGSEEDQAHNLSLLNNAQWLEVPAMFESRRRLVLVIEVGDSGTTALNGAIVAWGEAASGKTQEKAGE